MSATIPVITQKPTLLRYPESGDDSPIDNPSSVEGIFLHEKAEPMPNLPIGRFHRHPDGRIFVLACSFPTAETGGSVLVSDDEGNAWTAVSPFGADGSIVATDSGAFIVSDKGTLVAAIGDKAMMVKGTEWNEETRDGVGWELPTRVVRSVDEGKTWIDLQTLHVDWTGANRDMIQTRDGRIVFTSMKLLHNPGRHAVLTYFSDDDGKTWTASNVIDLGGNGHHDGVCEATLVELNDGRLLKYIRTNWGQFWRAYSNDGGQSWHVHGPAGIDVGSTPAYLHRLQSGRIALVWNRLTQRDGTPMEPRGGDGVWSGTPAFNYRKELSIAFSEDEGESWSAPVVFARAEKEISYPYIFEPSPGVLWITTGRFELRTRLREEDFLR